MINSPVVIEGTNLSDAWCTTVKKIVDCPGKEITPLVVSLSGFEENEKVRSVLENSLERDNYNSVTTVAETIFPDSLYKYLDEDRSLLYDEYSNNLKRIKKIDSSNRNGTYFSRLISYGDNEDINQLETIITSLKHDDAVRRSKLQASIFDPSKDHTNSRYQGFPCLQHVTVYKTVDNEIVLNSFYAIQLLYKKAYGNWLGLINLGKFIANETGRNLNRVNCFIGVQQLDISKKLASELLGASGVELNQ